jgi:broad specificity polyphosphatase/5'/3'-nucleotidase SurE
MRFVSKIVLHVFLAYMLVTCSPSVVEDANLLESLMKQKPDQFGRILEQRDSLEIQIIYTMIDRDEDNRPSFRSFYFNVDPNRYFYPASTVKLPISLLALEKLNQLAISGLNKYTPVFHDSVYSGQISVNKDTTSENGLPSIAHYIKKILVVSDNDASNRLYEFLGQAEANNKLQEKGYNVRILHRLERFLSPDENRHTEAVRFVQDGREIYSQPMLVNTDSIQVPNRVFRGKAYYKNDSLVKEPFEFTYKNFYSLVDQQAILKTLMFPESVEASKHFNLTEDDYRFVYKYMSQLPTETLHPPYAKDTTYYDAYCKFLKYGAEHHPIPDHIRIFNKVGNAYGYLIDNAYVVDLMHHVEFMLSAVINTNTDGIYNDGQYEYKTLGYPFMKNLGRLIYDYELKRHRPFQANLSKWKLTYETSRP